MEENIPLVFSCKSFFLEDILDSGKLLSKEQLDKKGIEYDTHPSNQDTVEKLGTKDNVTLYLDDEFGLRHIYGGLYGAKLIFDSKLIYKRKTFLLPEDQKKYNIEGEASYSRFCKERCKSRRSKRALIKEYHNGIIKGPLELHIPKEVSLKYLIGVLIPEDNPFIKKDDITNGIPVVSVKPSGSRLFPSQEDYKRSYEILKKYSTR